ncbi:hypothetical protein LTR85_008716 [Meristemomyces frigidus]|nr:hypothetical protein LTR85_008716 [Meristemomyces frigidus]
MQFKTLLPAALAVAAVSAQSDNATAAGNLTSVLSSNSNLTALNTLLASYPAIAESLGNRTNITLFAPSNTALSTLNSSGLLAQAASVDGLIQSLLSYHVLDGMFYAENITTTPQFPHTSLNSSTYSNVTGGQVVECRLDGMTAEIISGLKSVANVTQANVNFTGGVIHVVDNVLMIPSNVSTTASAANLTAFLGLLNATALTSTVDGASDITIFAPSNSAFQDVASGLSNLTTADLTNITTYHVLNNSVLYSSMLSNSTVPTLGGGNLTITYENGTVFINSARVVNADILISGGVMHVIDSVLNPNATMARANDTEGAGAATAFSGASSETAVPFTSGIATATTTIEALVTSTTQVAVSYTPAASGAGAAGGSGSGSSSSSGIAAAPTGAIGAAALFGGAAFLANF